MYESGSVDDLRGARHPDPREAPVRSVVVQMGDGEVAVTEVDEPRDLDEEVLRSSVKAKLFGTPGEPTRVGKFAIVKKLGSGGHGEVYAAYDEQLDRRVAIKVLRASVLSDPRRAQIRLLREARALAKVHHPNVVSVHEVGTTDTGDVYVVLEFVPGQTLREWVDAAPRTVEEIVRMYIAAGRGLAAAHHMGLVHRDFKPDNVLVDEEGIPRVLDFGLARDDGTTTAASATSSMEQRLRTPLDGTAGGSPLTMPGSALGTPAYMAPEQLRGDVVDARADQFGFAASLFEALYGLPPYSGETIVARSVAIAKGELEAPRRNQDATAVHQVLARALAQEAAARHESVDALLQALETALLPPARSPWPLRAAVAVIVVLVAALALQCGCVPAPLGPIPGGTP